MEEFQIQDNQLIRYKRRQAEGIAAAKANGVRFGPKPIERPDNYEECFRAWQAKK